MKKRNEAKNSGAANKNAKSRSMTGKFLSAFILSALVTAAAAVVGLLFYSMFYEQKMTRYIPFMIIPAVLSAVVSGIVSAVWFGRERKKITRLADRAEKITSGEYVKSTAGKSEDKARDSAFAAIDDAAEKYSELISANEELSDKSSELQNKCDNLEFSLLTAKSSPEFLEKTLGKVNALAKSGQIDRLAEFTETLTEMISASTLDAHTLVPLARELELIKRYLDIDEMISGVKTNYRMSVMCNIVNYRIIPYIVFPVIESFFEFANRDGIANYEIGVEVTSSPRNMVVLVRDNGAGLSQSNLEQIQKELDNDIVDVNRSSISIPNINRRIRLYYGEPYGLKLSSSKLGTVVRIYLPAKGNDF